MLIYIFLTTLYLSWLSYAHSFELYHDSGRVYLFGEDSSDKVKGWIKAIAKVTTSLKLDFIEYHDRLVISSFATVYVRRWSPLQQRTWCAGPLRGWAGFATLRARATIAPSWAGSPWGAPDCSYSSTEQIEWRTSTCAK